jgi:hypothetical protein
MGAVEAMMANVEFVDVRDPGRIERGEGSGN